MSYFDFQDFSGSHGEAARRPEGRDDMDMVSMSGGPLRAVNDGMLGEYFAPNATGEYFAANGLGGASAAEWLLAPGLTAMRTIARPQTSGLGVGPDDVAVGVGIGMVAVAAGVVALAGWLSFRAGAAMAPSKQARNKWGWIAVPVGLLAGAPGLGIMGIASTNND